MTYFTQYYSRLITVLLFSVLSFVSFSETFTSTQDGDWNNGSTWAGGVAPSTTLQNGDIVVVLHSVNITQDLKIRGTVTVQQTGRIVGNKKISVGKDVQNQGFIENYGTIETKELVIEPNGCAEDNQYPRLDNYGLLDISQEINIGNGEGCGSLYNYKNLLFGTGTIETKKVHVDGYLYNESLITASNEFFVHGGTVEGCGQVITKKLKFDVNNTRPGHLVCQDICKEDDTAPKIEVKHEDDLTPDNIHNNPYPDKALVGDLTTICGGNPLPVTLGAFYGVQEDRTNMLYWETVSEFDNDYFSVERSQDGENWEVIKIVYGAGTSNTMNYYSYQDNSAMARENFYRIKQTDFNGEFTYSKIIHIESQAAQEVRLFPNPATNNLHITGTSEKVIVLNYMGKVMKINEISQADGAITLDVSQLPNGLYYVKIAQRTYTFSKI